MIMPKISVGKIGVRDFVVCMAKLNEAGGTVFVVKVEVDPAGRRALTGAHVR